MERNRKTLIEEVKSELKKDAAAIDAGFIDRRIDELYVLDGLAPPELDAEQLRAAARTVRARAAWKRRNTLAAGALKRRLVRGLTRGAAAACGAFLVFFFVNHITALATGACLPSRAGITVCCGTKFCPCDTDNIKEPPPDEKNATFFDFLE
jgi:hypothetical protein